MRFMGAIACEDDIRTLFISRLNDNHARVIRDKNGEPLGDIAYHTRYPQEADIGYAIALSHRERGCQ
jgi:RimJ/RimL family protein N-acetyltransferase